MLVDPRPYTYEYRKPRFSNPTLYIYRHSANRETFMEVCTIQTLLRPMTILPPPPLYATNQVKEWQKPASPKQLRRLRRISLT